MQKILNITQPLRGEIRLYSRKAIFHMNLAIIYVRTSQWNEAELVSRRSIQLSPNDGEMWAILGESLAGLGTIDEAIDKDKKAAS